MRLEGVFVHQRAALGERTARRCDEMRRLERDGEILRPAVVAVAMAAAERVRVLARHRLEANHTVLLLVLAVGRLCQVARRDARLLEHLGRVLHPLVDQFLLVPPKL